MRAGSRTKRHRGNTRSSPTTSENNSTESEREMEEVGSSQQHIQVESESEEIPGGGKESVQYGHVVSKSTKCWLFFEVPPKGTTKSGCSLCGKYYKCVDGRNKLTTSALKYHLLRQHSTNPQVRAAYLLDEAEKVTDATPRQTIVRYAKQMSKQEGQIDPYPRGSQTDLKVNRALAHWLSCANLPYNVLDGGAFINFCFEMNPRFRVPSRPYLQRNFLDTGFKSSTTMLAVFLQYLD